MIAKILFTQNATPLERYLTEKQGPGNPVTEHNANLQGMAEEFRRSQRVCKQKGNEVIHIIQSWSPEESAKLTPDAIREMGVALVSRFAPDHSFIVATHTDEGHAHNHIALNPVNPKTKKRIQNKKVHLQTLRDLNDTIAGENGLSVLPPKLPYEKHGPSEKVRRIDRCRGHSYIMDLAQKARFARSHATNYGEYGAILAAFDVQIRVENENITYFYPGKGQGKRGGYLDPRLDKPALEKAFSENAVRLQRMPEARAALSEWVNLYEATRVTPERPRRGATEREFVSVPTPSATQIGLPEGELSRAKTQSL
ncbi:MAG: relaxase/mobilization nuclease domain-containing protein, partial [Bdellovibrionota bacterium]